MAKLLEFITLPLSLPIDPIWDFIIMAIIGEVVYRYAYYVAGEYGTSSNERFLIHWLVRFPAYFIVWFAACAIIAIYRFLQIHWWVLIVFGIAVIALIGVKIYKARKEKNDAKHDRKKNEG